MVAVPPIGFSSVFAGNGGSAGGSQQDGANSTGYPDANWEARGGEGALSSSPGLGGSFGVGIGCDNGDAGSDGNLLNGGEGGAGGYIAINCTFQGSSGGSGGGGYYGGGGGAGGQGSGSTNSFAGAGGGAGSSYTGGVSNGSVSQRSNHGDGYIIISW